MSRLLILALLLITDRTPAIGQNSGLLDHSRAVRYGEYWFEGFLGSSKIRMYVEGGCQEAHGLYYDVKSWKPILLDGSWPTDDTIQLTASFEKDEIAQSGATVGRLAGRIVASSFVGTWAPSGAQRHYSVRLARLLRPSCDGSGVWQHFSDPGWPITFSYPASWHVEISDESITLMCPDPMTLAYNLELDFSREEPTSD